MGMLASMTKGVKHMDLGHRPGLMGFAVDTAVGAGASFGIGEIHARYEDNWYGKHIAKIAAIVGKLGAVVASVAMGGGASWLTGTADAVGQAGVNAMALEWGITHGLKAKGKRAVVIGEKDALPAGGSERTAMGALPPADPGRAASFEQIAEMARMH